MSAQPAKLARVIPLRGPSRHEPTPCRHLQDAQRALHEIEKRYLSTQHRALRRATKPMVRAALEPLVEFIALVGLHMPVRGSRMLDPIFDAIFAAGVKDRSAKDFVKPRRTARPEVRA